MNQTQKRRLGPTSPILCLLILCTLISLLAKNEAQAAPQQTTKLITYTDTGFIPPTVTIAVGDTVTWRNESSAILDLRSGFPENLYLPLVTRGTNSRRATTLPRQITAVANDSFTSVVEPGGEFSYTFTTLNNVDFFDANRVDFAGLIRVIGTTSTPADSETDDPEPAPTEPAPDDPASDDPDNAQAGEPDPLATCDAVAGDGVDGGMDDGESLRLQFATSSDRTLLRWRWDDCTTANFNIYRNVNGEGEQLIATVSPIFDEAEAEGLLNKTDERWPELSTRLMGMLLTVDDFTQEQQVTGLQRLLNFVYVNGMAGEHWTNQYYPLALMAGWGYLDTDVQSGAVPAGATVVYRLEHVDDKTVCAGSERCMVKLIAGERTPLNAPTNLVAIDLNPETSAWVQPQTPSWGKAQRNRRYDGQVYLRWDILNSNSDVPPAAPVIGYDVYEAHALNASGDVVIKGKKILQNFSDDENTTDVTGDPDQPIIVGGLPNPVGGAADIPDYYFRYAPGDFETHTLCVGPRDLLNQDITFEDDGDLCSTPIRAQARDFIPPITPTDFAITVDHAAEEIVLTYAHTDTTDVNTFIIQRSTALHCEDEDGCWTDVEKVNNTVLSWTDTDPASCRTDLYSQPACWYRVMVVDTAGNRSVPTGPKVAIIHDVTPPEIRKVDLQLCPDSPDTTLQRCLDIHTDDAASIRINCRFSPDGEELFIAEVDGAVIEDLDMQALIDGVFQTPISLSDVHCRLIASDAYGNLSDIDDSPPINFSLDSSNPDQLAQPIIDGIQTQLVENSYQVSLTWVMPDSPVLSRFVIERVDDMGNVTTDYLMDPDVRGYIDTDVAVSHVYSYQVRAQSFLGGINDTLSEQRRHRLYAGETRPLVELSWLNDPTWNATSGTSLMIDAISMIENSLTYFAVYRSQQADRNFIQITPILQTPETILSYQDSSAQHGCYYYQVLTFRQRDGEPTGYTEPRRANTCLSIAQNVYTHNRGVSIPTFPGTQCSPAAHMNPPDYPFIFGGGFEILVEGLDGGVGPRNVSGGGWVSLETAQETLAVPVAFNNLTVNADGYVCSGTVEVDLTTLPGGALTLQGKASLQYRITTLTLQPAFNHKTSNADIVLDLPDEVLVVDDNGEELGQFDFSDATITKDLRFEYTVDATAGDEHNCASPAIGFRLETLPVDIVPLGKVSIDEDGITMTTTCLKHRNRYNENGAWSKVSSPYAALPQDELHNDGLLRTIYSSASTAITAAGLAGDFATEFNVAWTTAYPYAMRVAVDSAEFAIRNSQIVSGSTGAGTLDVIYHQTVEGNKLGTAEGTFDSLEIGARGDLFTAVNMTDGIDWDAFALVAGAWEFYAGMLSTPDVVATIVDGVGQTILWQPRPDAQMPVNFEGGSLLGELEPGLNRRVSSATLAWANCGTATIFDNVAMDTYLRRSGISQRQIPVIEPDTDMTVHGYPFTPERFDLHFLDNGLYERDISGWVDLPFPSNISVHLVDVWLTHDLNHEGDFSEAACIGGGRIPVDEQQHTLDYWDVNTRFGNAEFRQTLDEPTILWLLGDLRGLPHLALDANGAVIPAELAFDPDGNFNDDPRSGPKYDRPDYRFQDFPFLMSRFRLSDWFGINNGETPVWDTAATIVAQPDASTWGTDGFVGLRGALVAPYFGPIHVDAPETSDHIVMAAWDATLTGFASQPRVSKEWVKLRRINISFDYDHLVHAYDAASLVGRFVGFRDQRFVPDKYFDKAEDVAENVANATVNQIPKPDLPDTPASDISDWTQDQISSVRQRLQILQLDTATVIEPQVTGAYIGLSSGAAIFRALAQTQAGEPSIEDFATWSSKLNINATAAAVYEQQYGIILSEHGEFDFHETTDILDDLSDEDITLLLDQDNVGGRTQGMLAERGINFRRLRGVLEREGEGLQVQFKKFRVSLEAEIKGRNQNPDNVSPLNHLSPVHEEEEPPMFYAERMTLSIERHGDLIIQGAGVESSKFKEKLDSFDATLLINATTPQFEGGVTLYGLKLGSMDVDNGSAVVGIGRRLNYIGMSFDGTFSMGHNELEVGGDAIFGVIDTESEVLKFNFADALDQIADDLEAEPAVGEPSLGEPQSEGDFESVVMKGFYTRAYVNKLTLIKKGCLVDLKADAEIAAWFFIVEGSGNNYGGLLHPAVHGKVVCAVSVRGDIKLKYQFTDDQHRFDGDGYVAGGIGFCDPGSWGDWEDKWWGDRGCKQAGAFLEVDWRSGEGWNVGYETAREKLFP